MNSCSVPVAELIEELGIRASPMWARLALDRVDDRWHLRHAEITVATQPPGFSGRHWVYRDHAFVERRISLRSLTTLLASRRVRLAGYAVTLPPIWDHANSQRLSSFADYGGQRLPWPVVRYEIGQQETTSATHGSDLLVNDVGPSFAYYDSAFSAFFRPDGRTRWAQSAAVVLLVADVDARIAAVSIRPSEITVDVAGSNPSGCTLQTSTGGTCASVPIATAGAVTFPMPEPFDTELLVLLAHDGDWRDFRLINPRSAPSPVDPTILWDDPGLQFEELLASGEQVDVEFKSVLPGDSSESKRHALKTAPAFANGAGGVIVFGVDDDGQVVGLADATPERVASRLSNLVHDLVHPVPPFRVECHHVDGKLLVVVAVESGVERPYAMFRDPPQFYARHGSTTYHATREQIIAMSARHVPGSGPAY